MRRIHVAEPLIIARALMRKKRTDIVKKGVDLGRMLREILMWADSFVPSESGSILLDDPVIKLTASGPGKLYFAACYGQKSSHLIGTSISHTEGIVGRTYLSGKPYISKRVDEDSHFYSKIDQSLKHKSLSIICTPIIIGSSPVGVIELINRKGRVNFSDEDLLMLNIFAGYTATFIENSLAARTFEDLSKRDNLTGLYNDRYMFEFLESQVPKRPRDCADVSVIFFDLDHFKSVNDTYGHLAGSAVLREVGEILTGIFVRTPAKLVRYGGDEFVVIMPGTPIKIAAEFAETLRAAIESRVFLSKKAWRVTALKLSGIITTSIGVSSMKTCIKPGTEPRLVADALLGAADRAMYAAKQQGKNRVALAKPLAKQKKK